MLGGIGACASLPAGAALPVAARVPAPATRPAATGMPAAGGPKASGVKQRITVTAPSPSSTYATFTAYRRSGGRWVRAFGPWTARVGYNGVAGPGAKREGDGRTPSGTFGFQFFFGVRPNPGVAFSYRRARHYDVWDDDPSSSLYNEWVDQRHRDPGASPEPMDQVPVYDYGAVIGYNTGRVPGRGSAIFLHVGNGSDTAGCVSLPKPELLKVLRWLRPADHPRIAITAR